MPKKIILTSKQFANPSQRHVLNLVIFFLRKEPLLVDVQLPKDALINVCGDIHGQFYDLIKVLKLRGKSALQWGSH